MDFPFTNIDTSPRCCKVSPASSAPILGMFDPLTSQNHQPPCDKGLLEPLPFVPSKIMVPHYHCDPLSHPHQKHQKQKNKKNESIFNHLAARKTPGQGSLWECRCKTPVCQHHCHPWLTGRPLRRPFCSRLDRNDFIVPDVFNQNQHAMCVSGHH